MKPYLRFLLPVLAGSGLLLLSGCGELYDQSPDYHRHVVYREGRTYDRGYYGGRYADYGDRYDRHDYHPRYEDRSRVVVVAPRPAPYVRSYPRSHTYVAVRSGNTPVATVHRGSRPQTNVVVVSTGKKKKVYHHD